MDLKQFLIDVTVDSDLVNLEDVLEFELVYSALEDNIRGQESFLPQGGIKTVLPLRFVNNESLVESQETNPEVLVLRTIRECAELDSGIFLLVQQNKLQEIVDLKRQKANKLASVVDVDPYGFTKVLLRKTFSSLFDFTSQLLNSRVNEYNTVQQRIRRAWTPKQQVTTHHQSYVSSAATAPSKSYNLLAKELKAEELAE